jgi:hypothetical protein
MKFDPRKSFGYPVLRPDSDDYPRAGFQLQIDFNLKKDDPGKFFVEYDFQLGLRELSEFVREQNAAYWLRIACRSTFFSQMIRVDQKGRLEIDGAELRDVVEISGFVIAEKESEFRCSKINPEFGYTGFSLVKGQVMAHSHPCVYVVEKEFWKPLSSIFEYRINEELKEGEFNVNLDSESGYVEVFTNSSLNKQFHALERLQDGRSILINSIFFPTLVLMIARIQESPDSTVDKKWARVLIAKATAKHIDLNNSKVLMTAQKLLDYPFQKLVSSYFEKTT